MSCASFSPSMFSSTFSSLIKSIDPKSVFPNQTRFLSSTNWDHILQTASLSSADSSNLNGFMDKVRYCNRGSQLRSEFVPFVVDDEIVGYIHNGFTENLKKFEDVFSIVPKRQVRLHTSLNNPDERTEAVARVIESLGTLIPGIRNENKEYDANEEQEIEDYCNKMEENEISEAPLEEVDVSIAVSSYFPDLTPLFTTKKLYPVTSSFGKQAVFSLERAAAPYFGIKAYGVHMNGYVEKNGQKYLWVAKRSDMKPTYPGMLDHLVAGGLPHGISCKENLLKECQEEAGIPRYISNSAVSVGAVSYMDIDGYKFKRDFLFCYDLKLPEDFVPNNEDGEVGSFRLLPITHVANMIRETYLFKPNCCLVIIDFLIRHGYITPDDHGFVELLQSLRTEL